MVRLAGIEPTTLGFGQRCRQLADRKGLPWETAAVFKDRGSGMARPECRPAYSDMLTAIRTGRCDLVLTDDLSRLTRDMMDFVDLSCSPFEAVRFAC